MLSILNNKNVQDVFCELLERNGEVTSKEVKDELRNRGFWALQAYVSWCIKSNYKDWGAILQYNGKYNIYFPEKVEEDDISSTNNVASTTFDVDFDNNRLSVATYKTEKCRVTTTQRISDDETHINIYSPKEKTSYNVIVNKYDFNDAQYITFYNSDVLCYVGSEDTIITGKQARYYAWKIFKDKYSGMEYFDIRCKKIF